MNIKLDTYVSKTKGKQGYIIEKDGVILERVLEKGKTSGDLKDLILENLLEGLKHVKLVVSHDDVLTIIVQNRDAANWLITKEEAKFRSHVYITDQIFDVFDELDCRYKVVFLPNSLARRYILGNEVEKKENLESVMSLLDFEQE